MSSDHWYVAVLVVESSVAGEASEDPLLDLQYRLVRATNADDAYEKAVAVGKASELSYKNSAGPTVRWTFAGLHDLCELDEEQLIHGTEIYSRRCREPARDYVVPRDQLTVFFLDANKHKTARQIIEGE